MPDLFPQFQLRAAEDTNKSPSSGKCKFRGETERTVVLHNIFIVNFDGKFTMRIRILKQSLTRVTSFGIDFGKEQFAGVYFFQCYLYQEREGQI